MKNIVHTSFPHAECPHCNSVARVDDYHDLEAGDSFECLSCNKEIYILSTDITIDCELSTENKQTINQ